MENEGRRKFLGLCLGGLAALAAAAATYPLYRYLAPRKGKSSVERIMIPVKEVPEGTAKFFEFAGSPAALVRRRGGEWIALSAVCTHLGCIVQWEKSTQDFLCPCHAGHYSADGTVLSGPPPKPLAKIPFIVENGNIIIG